MQNLRNTYKRQTKLQAGENFTLRNVLVNGRKHSFYSRLSMFSAFLDHTDQSTRLYARQVISAADREVTIRDPFTGDLRSMLMFGSNNYLGLANHPYVREQVHRAVDEYGVGVGGPPLLNGYTRLHKELEERLSALKHTEATLLFPTGYSANVGLISGLLAKDDCVIYDVLSHASFLDGLKMTGATAQSFRHNDVAELERALRRARSQGTSDTFVGVEGVYSMDGDLAPLDRFVPLCRLYGAILMLDDAHGTGVLGTSGSGTAEHFGLDGEIDISMGTFSKTFGVIGGFVSASKPIVDYLRYFARSHMFSASLPPPVIAAVLAGLDVLEREPELRRQLLTNVRYAADELKKIGHEVEPEAAIITLTVPEEMDIRESAYHLHQAGLFVNAIEYPAVPLNRQRFRISLMATHTKNDIDRLVQAIAQVWTENRM